MAGSPSGVPFYNKVLTRTEKADAINNGAFYIYIEKTAAVPAASSHDLVIYTGLEATGIVQLDTIMRAAELNLKLYEGSDWTDGSGTLVPFFNNNRAAAIAGIDALRQTVVRTGATINADGTLIADWDILGTESVGGNDVIDNSIEVPIVLAANTKYILRVTNTSAAAADLEVALQVIDRSY